MLGAARLICTGIEPDCSGTCGHTRIEAPDGHTDLPDFAIQLVEINADYSVVIMSGPVVSRSVKSPLAAFLSEVVLVMDINGNVIDELGSPAGLLGFGKRIGTGMGDYAHPEDLPKFLEFAAQALVGGLGWQACFTGRLRRVTGEYRQYEFMIVNQFDNPDVGGIVVRTSEISDGTLSLAEEAKINDGLLSSPWPKRSAWPSSFSIGMGMSNLPTRRPNRCAGGTSIPCVANPRSWPPTPPTPPTRTARKRCGARSNSSHGHAST